MTEPTRDFFKRLAGQHQPLLESMSGSVRFDIADGERTEHWFLEIHKGDVTVSHKDSDADCVMIADSDTFDEILTGKMNAMSALLRGALQIEGKAILLAALQRLFPGSRDAAPQPAAGYARRSS